MKETIILTSLNEREFLRSLAKNGYPSFQIRLFNSAKLSKEALLRNGIIICEKEISLFEQEMMIYSLTKEVDYFKLCTYSDAKNIASSINEMRMYCKDHEEETLIELLSKGDFKDKNMALLDIYQKYLKELEKNNYIDAIGLIRMAIEHCEKMDAYGIMFKETLCQPLEQRLFDILFEEKREISILDFVQKDSLPLSKITYLNGYGQVNEVEAVLSQIAENNIPYEDCLIAILNDSYLYHFMNIQNTYDVKFSYASGLPITLSNASRLLVNLKKWEDGYFSWGVFNDLVNCSAFDQKKFWQKVSGDESIDKREKEKIIKSVGDLKLSVHKDEDKWEKYVSSVKQQNNRRLAIIRNIYEELVQGYGYLIRNYTKIENESLDSKAINLISNTLDEYFIYQPNGSLNDIMDDILGQKIQKELSRPSTICIAELKDCLSIYRKHLYICGLNANNFPGSPKENYLLLDCDLVLFEEKKIKVINSKKKIQNRKDLLMNVIDIANAFNGSIHLSYYGYNLNELKTENPSSMMFEIYKKENGDMVTMDMMHKTIGEQKRYFDAKIASYRNIGLGYMSGNQKNRIENKEDMVSSVFNDRVLSPSALDLFFSCPKRFYLSYILAIDQPLDDRPFDELPSNDEGTLIHQCMQDYGRHPHWTIDEFLSHSMQRFDNYFAARVPLTIARILSIRKSFEEMLMVAYKNDPKNRVDRSESYLGVYQDPITGLNLGGIVDRVEKLENGHLVIVDYKTYKQIRNIENDPETCFQVLLYAYILENMEHSTVERCEYRYLRNPRVIVCDYQNNQNIKDQLVRKLEMVKEALDSGIFDLTEDEKNCRYCHYQNICGKNNPQNLEEEE